jgi:hypothetical protein
MPTLAMTDFSPELTHGPERELSIADLRRAGCELARCGTKLPLALTEAMTALSPKLPFV